MAEVQSWWSGQGSPVTNTSSPPNLDFQPFEIPKEDSEDAEQLLTRRVHVLGMGSIGTLVAHSLRHLPNPPPISLQMHRPEMYPQFNQASRLLRLINKQTEINDEVGGFDVDILEQEQDGPYWRHIPDTPQSRPPFKPSNPLVKEETMASGEVFIYNMIVAVKANATVKAMQAIKHRMDSRTTILFLQNGMGQLDELNEKVFTDPATRPTYMMGIISHGAYLNGTYTVIHAGFGTIALGIHRDTDKYPLPPKSSSSNISEISEEERRQMYPTDEELYSNLSSRYLLRTLTRSPILACAPFPYLDIFQLQLEKLCMNAVLNPLTALLDVPNGEMLDNLPLSRAQRLLMAEISMVIRGLPELEGVPNVNFRFSPSRLEKLFHNISTRTAANSSSMREDIRRNRGTEIDYINGYIVNRGEQMRVKCVLNYLIMQLIHGKIYKRTRDPSRPHGVSNIEGEVESSSFGNAATGLTLEDKGTSLR